MMGEVLVRAVEQNDEAAWRQMWAGYNDFYEVSIPGATTSTTWRRILDPKTNFGAIIAFGESQPIGFANYVLHPYTWSERDSCLMEDLFVIPEARGRGAGRALIQHLLDLGRREGWTKVYWITHETNATARRLYDSFRPADGFIQYAIPIEPTKE